VSDHDDIDALLESMEMDEDLTLEEPIDEDPIGEEITDEDSTVNDESDVGDIDELPTSIDIESANNEDTPETEDKDEALQEGSLNKAKIETLTEEYVAPLIATDFGDILAKSAETELITSDASKEDLIEDSIDSLVEGAFDEDTLAELLNDQTNDQTSDYTTELTPDFSDQNVLSGLLNDNESDDDKSIVSEATEINDIQELDSLDFDELLANIEEESSVTAQSADFNEDLDVGDDFSLSDFDSITSNIPSNDNQKLNDNEKNFVSVDSLLSESQNEARYNEPYDKPKMDVGLNEFPEFTNGVNKVDVDIDENGMTAKLDLAKVYIEIGDNDNAHVILQEVVREGDTQQKIVAQELLDSL
jgi:pilus assembly protein FimV